MILIRDYTDGDKEEILALLTNILKKYDFSVELYGVDSDLVDIKNAYLKSGGAFRVLVDNEKIIGFYGVRRLDSSTCELKKIYLNDEYHARGLGGLMLKDSFSTALSLSYTHMVLETHSKFESAFHMYKKYGFTICKPYSGNEYCDLAMQKELN